MKKKEIFKIAILSLLLVSCRAEPDPIKYGQDQCSYCMMNIVDKAHAAQYVTKKGKQYKFDSIECLINQLSKENEQEIQTILVADYTNPGTMIDAKNATYIISENIKSPMGANLSATATEDDATKITNEYGGDIYDWTEIKVQIAESE